MAIIKFAGIVEQMSGKIGGQSISNFGAFSTIRNITQANKTPTVKQSFQRTKIGELSNKWRFITQAQRNNWENTAFNYTYINRVGDEITRNRFQVFMFTNLNLKVINALQIDDAPAFIPIIIPNINLIDITTGQFTIQASNVSASQLYAINGVANLSFGKKANKNLLRQISVIDAEQLFNGYSVIPALENTFGPITFPNHIAISVITINKTTGNREQFSEIFTNL